MEDRKTQQLKANYDQMVTSVARNVYLKMHEVVRDINESKIKEEDKNSIKLYLVRMAVDQNLK